MFSALAITIIGSVIFLKPEAAGGPMSGLGNGLFFLYGYLASQVRSYASLEMPWGK